MTKSVFKVRISKKVDAQLLKDIKQLIPEEERTQSIRVRTADSIDALSSVQEIILEIIHSKPACIMIATVILAWIRAKHSKGIVIKKDGFTLECKNLTEHELSKILESKHSFELMISAQPEDKQPTK